jgi:hypothetical protein
MKVTREPADTVMSFGETPADVSVIVVVFVDPPPPPLPLLPLDGPVELPPHPAARRAAASAATAKGVVLIMVRALRRTSARC